MIRNRLAELLSERQLKITEVAHKTGISRNTITSTVQNDSKMIQYNTIDVLCRYLNIKPDEFFDYIPIDYSLAIESTQGDIETIIDGEEEVLEKIIYKFDFFIDVKGHGADNSYSLTGYFIHNDSINVSLPWDDVSVEAVLNFNISEEKSIFYDSFYSVMSAGHQTLFNKEVENVIQKQFLDDLENKSGIFDTFKFYSYSIQNLVEGAAINFNYIKSFYPF